MTDVTDSAAVFDEHRGLLFSIAYRMVGTAMEAEDLVQETYLRWRERPEKYVQSPKAYLSTIITRLAIDHLRSAQVQRESYIGPWLPEPVLTAPGDTPQESLMLAESLSTAFLVILESLSPVERAVYLLREVFDYDYQTVAQIVGKSEANCRQIVSRARRRIKDRRPRFEVSSERQSEAVGRFIEAAAGGDMHGLLSVLAEDVTWTSDGGGMVGVARKAIRGAEKVARFVLNLTRRAPEGVEMRPVPLNGGPGLIIYVEGRPYAAVTFAIAQGYIVAVHAVVNPDKLGTLPFLSELQDILD